MTAPCAKLLGKNLPCLLLLTLSGCGSFATPASHDSPALVVGQLGSGIPRREVFFGGLSPGSQGKVSLKVVNRASHPVRFASYLATCPCVSVTPLPLELPVGDEAQIQVQVDLEAEGDEEYSGAFGVPVEIRDPAGLVLGELLVRLVVNSPVANGVER